jgi:hypothetical protein
MIIKSIALTTSYLLLITGSLEINHKFLLGKNCQRTNKIMFYTNANTSDMMS